MKRIRTADARIAAVAMTAMVAMSPESASASASETGPSFPASSSSGQRINVLSEIVWQMFLTSLLFSAFLNFCQV